MLAWLTSIGDSIGIVVQYVTSLLNGIRDVFVLVGQSFAFLTIAISNLPSVLLVFCISAITITIVFQLIGR